MSEKLDIKQFLSRFQRRGVLLFILAFALTLPFPLSFFPSPGDFFHPFFLKLNHWSAEHLFGLQTGLRMQIESDSTGFYIHLFHLLVFSAVGGLAWTLFFKKTNENRLQYIIYITAAYILAFFLLKYGFDKVFKVQFYLPEPNTLYTPMGFLSKDILFWSTVGSSYSYSVFSGVMEVLPAFLLFSRRTRLLGGLIAFGVMLHVLIINFGFDISVKLLSVYLLLLSVLVIRPYFKSLAGIFISEQSHFPRPAIEALNRDKAKWMRFLKAFLVGSIIFESLFIYIEKGQFNDDLTPRPKFHGAYELIDEDLVTHIKSSREKSVFFGDLSAVKRIFIHRRGYFILQRKDDSMQDFPAILSFQSNEMTVKAPNGFIVVQIYSDPKTDNYSFTWSESGQRFTIITDQLDLGQLPLLKEQFHWAAE